MLVYGGLPQSTHIGRMETRRHFSMPNQCGVNFRCILSQLRTPRPVHIHLEVQTSRQYVMAVSMMQMSLFGVMFTLIVASTAGAVFFVYVFSSLCW